MAYNSSCRRGVFLASDGKIREVEALVIGETVFKKNKEIDKFKIQKKILADNSLNTYTPDFSQVATTAEGLFKTRDNDGDTYYYRGAVTNNYSVCWFLVENN